jgi:hypothetical protein
MLKLHPCWRWSIVISWVYYHPVAATSLQVKPILRMDGFTYADYARRGFFELVAVAFISLGLYYSLSMVTKRALNEK